MMYRQHWMAYLAFHWPDSYTLGKGSLCITLSKGFRMFDKDVVLPYREISTSSSEASLMGWLFGYRKLKIYSEGRDYILDYVPRTMVEDLKTRLNEKED